jgi:hypothetical protein
MHYRFVTRLSTSWVLILFVVGLIVWDVLAFRQGTPGTTVSEVVLAYARQHPWLPFSMGAVAGHLFWPQVAKPKKAAPTPEPHPHPTESRSGVDY